MRRRLAVVAAVALLIGGVAAPPATAQTDAVSVARALINAENAHNVSGAVSLFAPGAIVNLPTGTLITRAEIEQWQRDLAAGNFRAEITPPVAVTPEIVTFSGTIALDTFRRLGIASLESTWELTIQLGLIRIFNFNFTPAAGARLQAALAGAGAGAGGGGAPAGGATGGGSTQTTPTTAASGRTLALTGTDNRTALLGMTAIALGGLVLVMDRRTSRTRARVGRRAAGAGWSRTRRA